MSKTIPAGAQDAPPTEPKPVTEAVEAFALTVALQKTEWHELRKHGITTRLMTLQDKSGRRFAAVFFACATDNLEADDDKFTFYANGVDVDDIVARTKGVT